MTAMWEPKIGERVQVTSRYGYLWVGTLTFLDATKIKLTNAILLDHEKTWDTARDVELMRIGADLDPL